jgi:hypothetical protein
LPKKIEIFRELPAGFLEESDLLKIVGNCVEPYIRKQDSKTALEKMGMSKHT